MFGDESWDEEDEKLYKQLHQQYVENKQQRGKAADFSRTQRKMNLPD